MKAIARTILVAALIGLALPAQAQSIESKIEQFGKMSYVRVTGLKQVVREGLMTLQAELYNDDHTNQTVYWRTRWLDEAGMQVWDDEPWKQELIYGNQRKILRITAPTRKATDFRIELQSPKNEGVDSAPTPGT